MCWKDAVMTPKTEDTQIQAIKADSNHVHEWVVDDTLPNLRQCLTCSIAEPF